MKKRIISIILCLALFAGAMPTAFAAKLTNVNTVQITVAEPAAGKTPGDASVPSDVSTQVTNTRWEGDFNSDGSFKSSAGYSVYVTIEIKDQSSKRLTSSTSSVKATINGNTAEIVSWDKFTAVLKYSFYQRVGSKIVISVTEPVANAQATAPTIKSADAGIYIKSYEWTSLRDNGTYAPNSFEYLHVTFGIEDGYNAKFKSSKTSIYVYVNDNTARAATVKSLSDTELTISYGFGYLKAKGDTINYDAYYTESYADTATENQYDTLIITSNDQISELTAPQLKNDDYSLLMNYKKLIITGSDVSAENVKSAFFSVKEIWLAPSIDAYKFLDEWEQCSFSGSWAAGFMNTDECAFYIPKSLYPYGRYDSTYNEDRYSSMAAQVKLYSGTDVISAAEKGDSATTTYCPGHSYTRKLDLGSTEWFASVSYIAQYPTCTKPGLAYYSCVYCGKIEHNDNHTYQWKSARGVHSYWVTDLSDANYVGINASGDAIYAMDCVFCGASCINAMDTGGSWSDVLAKTSPTNGDDYASYRGCRYSVVANKALTATTTSWAKSEVRLALTKDLVDTSLMGSNYTSNITRLQFCSVAVKLAEKLLGASITPAASNTFTDTSNEYVLKAYAAGITTGTSATTFSPNATLTREQMATFLYRALQYVKNNSEVKYTYYTSQLSSYKDSSKVSSWATEGMAFMNALGLIKGTSDTTLSPSNTCTIQEALIVAYRSLSAPKIGWYMVRNDTELSKGSSPTFLQAVMCYYPETDIAACYASVAPGERYWCDGTTYGSYYMITERYSGLSLFVPDENIWPIKAD